LRWKPAIFIGRLRDGLLFTFSYFAFLGQNEVDKLVILQLAGDRMVGVYVITMRILDLTAAPLRPLFVIYSRKLLLAGRAKARLLGEIVQFEALIAASSIAGCIALVAILTRWPNALGHNIASAHGLLAALLVVPAAKNLIEFHSELFFAFDRMGVRGACAWGVLALKAGAIALLIRMLGGGGEWGPWLNAIYLVLYLMSLATLRALLARERRACERRA
jgi:O-antigen/teichoic acid export membrane protein